MGKSKKSINKDEVCEDCCFHCKDGGSLRICDYKDCLKAYHPKCVEEDDSFLESEVPWTCSWHSCFNCKRTPKFHCYCCPNAVCRIGLCDFKFAIIGKEGGICSHCLSLVGLLEGSKDPNLDQGKIDFNDTDTYEYFLKHYWSTVKKSKGLTSVHVSNAIEQLNMVKNSKDFRYISASEDSNEVEDEYEPESSNDRSNNKKRCKNLNKRKTNRDNQSKTRRTGNYKEKEFNEWGSSVLIDFLVSIGKDTTEELSQNDVNAIVLQYCIDNKLFDPVKKKKVLCDEKLKSLFRRKSVFKNRIYNLLTPHFAENLEQYEESESQIAYESEDKNERALISCKRQRSSTSKIEPQKIEGIDVDEHQQGFASMVAQNIKRLYLNQSLVEELLEEPENFDEKVIGPFARIKSDPYDYMQKNCHMLVKVTGVFELYLRTTQFCQFATCELYFWGKSYAGPEWSCST